MIEYYTSKCNSGGQLQSESVTYDEFCRAQEPESCILRWTARNSLVPQLSQIRVLFHLTNQFRNVSTHRFTSAGDSGWPVRHFFFWRSRHEHSIDTNAVRHGDCGRPAGAGEKQLATEVTESTERDFWVQCSAAWMPVSMLIGILAEEHGTRSR